MKDTEPKAKKTTNEIKEDTTLDRKKWIVRSLNTIKECPLNFHLFVCYNLNNYTNEVFSFFNLK